jgi:hypothetical protein
MKYFLYTWNVFALFLLLGLHLDVQQTGLWGRTHNTFNLQLLQVSCVFVPGKPFQPSVIFAG